MTFNEIFVIGKYTDILQGMDVYGENFPLGYKFLGLSFPGKMFTEGGEFPGMV